MSLSLSSDDVGCPVDECSLEVDIHIVSSDTVTMGAHTNNLALFGNGFPSEKVIYLEEKSEVLQLLLRFMHHARQPDLSTIPFSTLFSLAEAAEKYQVYSAMGNCKAQLGYQISEDPIQIWLYAVKYDYPSLADEAAFLTLNCSPTDLTVRAKEYKLSMARVVQWHLYREQWSRIFMSVLKPSLYCSCAIWGQFQFKVIADIGDQLTRLKDLNEISEKNRISLKNCSSCFHYYLNPWSRDILKDITDLQTYSHSDFDHASLIRRRYARFGLI